MGTTHYKMQDLKKVNQKRFYFHISQEFINNLEKLSGVDRIIAGRKAIAQAGHKIFKPLARSKARKYSGPLRGWYKYGYKGKKRIPGTLIKSIVFQMNRDKSQMNGVFSVKDPVGHLIEYGHVTRKGMIKKGILKGFQKKNKGTGKATVGAFPFMRPAIIEGTAPALDKMAVTLEKALLGR